MFVCVRYRFGCGIYIFYIDSMVGKHSERDLGRLSWLESQYHWSKSNHTWHAMWWKYKLLMICSLKYFHQIVCFSQNKEAPLLSKQQVTYTNLSWNFSPKQCFFFFLISFPGQKTTKNTENSTSLHPWFYKSFISCKVANGNWLHPQKYCSWFWEWNTKAIVQNTLSCIAWTSSTIADIQLQISFISHRCSLNLLFKNSTHIGFGPPLVLVTLSNELNY